MKQVLKNKFKNFWYEKFLSKYVVYIMAIILCLVILTLSLKLWKADISIPFMYNGDGLSINSYIKGIVDNNSMIQNKYIGYLSSFSIVETPMSDWMHILIIRGITLLIHNHNIILNTFYLLTFPMITVASLFTFLKFKINPIFAIVGSILYTFMPYHFLRGEDHLFLSAYYSIPFACLLILKLYLDDNFIFEFSGINKRSFIKFANKKNISIILLCLIISSSGVYYAFFSCFFIILVGIIMSCMQGKIYKFIVSAVLVCIITLGCVMNLVPGLIYNSKSNEKLPKVERSYMDIETYGLKISQLILPITGHRIDNLAEKKDKYNSTVPLVNENDTASLGIIGSIGFIISILYVFVGKKNKMIKNIGLLNLAAILLGTVGGFGIIVGFFATKMIRSYNRISIFIAFFSIFLVIYLLDMVYKKYLVNKKIKLITIFISMIILVLGIYDQTSLKYIPNYEITKKQYKDDENFVKNIEKNVLEDTKIFQLPYIPYPEEPSPNKMGYYDLLKPYLHSQKLYWSYGSIKGKKNDIWQREVAQKSVEDFIEEIYSNGFKGVYIDTYGYDDENKYNELINNITKFVKSEPIYSDNKRLVFISLYNYK